MTGFQLARGLSGRAATVRSASAHSVAAVRGRPTPAPVPGRHACEVRAGWSWRRLRHAARHRGH
jgi:hypothetical protein